MYAYMFLFMKSGSSFSSTMSEIISLPFFFSTLNASSKTLFLFGDKFITQLDMTMSAVLSATGKFSISPRRNSTFLYPPFLQFSRALSSISVVMSTPITFPFGPTFFAVKKQSKPPPEPKSTTVSPSFSIANATGFPQPKFKSAPSGTEPNSLLL